MLIIATFGDMEIVVVLKVSWIINIQILFVLKKDTFQY